LGGHEMRRRPMRRPGDSRTRRRTAQWTGPPRWYKRHRDDAPCACTRDSKTVRSTVGYSDTVYLLFACPECGARWTGGIEG
jgi:hypothetical protein